MTLEQKRELLIKWKESGLSLPKWWRENADELDLPHLSTLYAWVKQLGFSTEPGAEVTNEHDEEPDEMGDLDDSQEEDDDEETQGDEETQDNSQGQEKNDEKEIDEEPEEPEEDVIAKDRIEQLAPSTVPEPAQPEKALDVDESKPGIKPQTWVIIGGAVVLGIGAYLLARKIIKRREQRPEQRPEQNTMPGGNPFAGDAGYITIDDF